MTRTVVITKQGIPGSPSTGYAPGGTDVAVADGGTGASSAGTARTNLGLGNVDNTSDANKPVSTAQAAADAALDTRLDVLEADTGWILPTLATDITVRSTFYAHLGYRRVDKHVYVTISLDIANPAASKLLFQLPEGFRPGGRSPFVRPLANVGCYVDTDGSVRTGTTGAIIETAFSFVIG